MNVQLGNKILKLMNLGPKVPPFWIKYICTNKMCTFLSLHCNKKKREYCKIVTKMHRCVDPS